MDNIQVPRIALHFYKEQSKSKLCVIYDNVMATMIDDDDCTILKLFFAHSDMISVLKFNSSEEAERVHQFMTRPHNTNYADVFDSKTSVYFDVYSFKNPVDYWFEKFENNEPTTKCAVSSNFEPSEEYEECDDTPKLTTMPRNEEEYNPHAENKDIISILTLECHEEVPIRSIDIVPMLCNTVYTSEHKLFVAGKSRKYGFVIEFSDIGVMSATVNLINAYMPGGSCDYDFTNLAHWTIDRKPERNLVHLSVDHGIRNIGTFHLASEEENRLPL